MTHEEAAAAFSDTDQAAAAAAEVPRLSPSIAKILLAKSPGHAWAAHRLGGNVPTPSTEGQLRGAILDRLFFGKPTALRIIKAKDFKTKAAREERDEAEANGEMAITEERHKEYQAAVDAWQRQCLDLNIFFSGESHRRYEWETRGTPCAGELDHVVFQDGSAFIWDLKTCVDASPETCVRTIANYGYDVQHAAYMEAIETLHPSAAGRVRMSFLFAEIHPPWCINIVRLGAEFMEIGRRKWFHAVDTWGECLRSDYWPGYTVPTIAMPRPWMLDATNFTEPSDPLEEGDE